ncbi:AmmeMemoRadiSam system protein A, partial [Patescibacteria group bacterium]|nr:AmmeMemoRadiSam system protein A [Patescibacteria group bacterium]
GFSSKGKEFDKKIIDLLKNKKHQEILTLDEELIKDAAECGYRSILILLGIFDKLNYQTDMLSYECPFGVGYLVANLEIA